MADLKEHKAIVAKYATKLNTAALDGMGRTYALVLSNKDSQYVACGDDEEKATVRANFLKKKLGLTNSEADLNAAIEAVCVTMKEDRFKSRLAMYYLLADKFGKLAMFVK
jgi:NAD(P)-dependent dehydrogenase (short-subunit alcohol dehydrogenase family)